ncbi:hypothetical protein CDIK_2199 [Cucumispora dikerogammari]|nr:hypothetical protein CDIK_2199 [Cucumispora dikerogammari]
MDRVNKFLANTCKKKQKLIFHNNKLQKIDQIDIKTMKKFSTTKCAHRLDFRKMQSIKHTEFNQLEYSRIQIPQKTPRESIIKRDIQEYLIPKKFHERISAWNDDIKPNSIAVNIPESANSAPVFQEQDLFNLEEVLRKDFKKNKTAKKLDVKTLVVTFLMIDKVKTSIDRFIQNEKKGIVLNHFSIKNSEFSFWDVLPVYIREIPSIDQEIIKEIRLKNHKNCCNLPERILKLNFSGKPIVVTHNKHFLAALFENKLQIFQFFYTEQTILEKTGLIKKSNNKGKKESDENKHLGFTERVEKFKNENQFTIHRTIKSLSNKLVYKISGAYDAVKFVSNNLFLVKKTDEEIIIEKYI